MNALKRIIFLIALASTAARAGGLVDTAGVDSQHAFVAVEYADTLQGVQAMFAVRVCSTEDLPLTYGHPVGLIAAKPPLLGFIHEQKAEISNDIVVRVIDVAGREVARHEGATNVCGFARLAGSFIALDDGHATGVTR